MIQSTIELLFVDFCICGGWGGTYLRVVGVKIVDGTSGIGSSNIL